MTNNETYTRSTKPIRLFIFACLLACSCLALLAPQQVMAQLSTATMFGTVSDSTGAVIPNAVVLLTQKDTNFTRQTTTNGQGQYRAEFLPLGPYSVKVTAAGFRETVRSGIVLTGAQEAEVNYGLELGAESSVVEVTTELPLVNLGNSTLGRTVDNREIDNLPLVDRSVYTLLTLTPGVQQVQQENSIGVPMEHVIINGSSDNMVGQVTYYLDGGTNMTGVRNTGNVVPNPDAIDQFSVQTSNYSAQYGRTGAGGCVGAHQVRYQPGAWIDLLLPPRDKLQLECLGTDDENASAPQLLRRNPGRTDQER